MAVTITLYNLTASLFAAQTVTLANLKLMLLGAAASFNATHTTITSVAGANEVSGNGWDVGGELLAGVAASVVTTNDAKIDANDIDVAASGGSIGPASFACIYDDTSNKPLAFIDFGGAKEAEDGVDFLVVWDTTGIFKFTVT